EPDAGVIRPLGDVAGMTDLVARWATLKDRVTASAGAPVKLSDIELLAPIPRPARNVMCVGKNYYDHAHEFTRSGFDSSATSKDSAVPTAPIIFTKVPESVIADGEAIRY